YGQAPQYGQPAQGAPAADPYGPPVGSRFGTQAYGADGQYGTVTEPAKFRKLLTLTLASAAVYLLSLIPGLLGGTDGFRAQLEEQLRTQPGITPEDIAAFTDLAGVFFIGTVVGSLVIALALYLVVYLGLRKAKNWARILGIVLAILGTLSTLVGLITLAATGQWISLLLSLAFIVVNILWLVHAFDKDVAAYTKQGRRLAA
ncbi:hypothetical protein, partial [Micrococcus sp.]|uniref:hypothetical protein n=1 Tax=Micrococcus sp. TaxID=1271 RepID=UPI0026DAD1E4